MPQLGGQAWWKEGRFQPHEGGSGGPGALEGGETGASEVMEARVCVMHGKGLSAGRRAARRPLLSQFLGGRV